MKDIIVDYLRFMRIPGVVGLAMTPVVGALCVNVFTPHILASLFLIGVISKIYGFVMNDYFDVEIDRLSKNTSQRALVKGTISKKTALFIVISCFFLGYIAVFIFFYRPHPLFYMGLCCIILADILGIIYNVYGKRLIGSDFLIALSECMFLLFGALVVLPTGTPGIIFWIIFILLFNEQLYMNAVAGGLKDADHDYIRGVKNIALAIGVSVKEDKTIIIPIGFKAFGLGERILSSVIVFIPFIFYKITYTIWQIAILLVFAALIIISSFKMLNIKKFERKNIQKLIATQLLSWHFLVPIMLVGIIGLKYSLLLITLPLIWYVLISTLIGQKLFQSQI